MLENILNLMVAQNRRYLLVLTTYISLFFIFSLTPAHSQTSDEKVSTSISPVTFELTAVPGETISNIVKVTNVGTESISYVMTVEPFVGNELGQATVIPSGEDKNPELALKDWVTLSPAKFTLAPKEQKLVTAKIIIPKNAEPGGRYGTILAGTDHSQDAIDGTGAKVGQKVGTLVLLRVQGVIAYKAYLKSFAASQKMYAHSPVTFSTRIHNESTVHIKPKGFITLVNFFGKKVADVPFEERNALPASDRLLETISDQKLPIGRYTATLAIVYGDKNETLTAATSFIIFPWKTGVPIIIGGVIVLWFLAARHQRIIAAIRILAGKQ